MIYSTDESISSLNAKSNNLLSQSITPNEECLKAKTIAGTMSILMFVANVDVFIHIRCVCEENWCCWIKCIHTYTKSKVHYKQTETTSVHIMENNSDRLSEWNDCHAWKNIYNIYKSGDLGHWIGARNFILQKVEAVKFFTHKVISSVRTIVNLVIIKCIVWVRVVQIKRFPRVQKK